MKVFSLIAILIMGWASELQAGGISSGGGGAFVRRDPLGRIEEAELLDLWEAEKIYKWKLIYGTDSVNAQIEAAVKRLSKLDKFFAKRLEKEIKDLQKTFEYLPYDILIAPPADALNKYLKKWTTLEGMMIYDGDL